MKPGSIIVTSFSTPVLAPALIVAGGLICEQGGMTSHGAIIARELGIPCLVGVAGSLTKLKHGQRIILNATHGYVETTVR